jgi:hypothetical protein
MRGHSFAYEGKCTGCKQEFAGCKFCRARRYGGDGCSCSVEAMHVTRSMRWRLATGPVAAAPAPVLEQPSKPAARQTAAPAAVEP